MDHLTSRCDPLGVSDTSEEQFFAYANVESETNKRREQDIPLGQKVDQ